MRFFAFPRKELTMRKYLLILVALVVCEGVLADVSHAQTAAGATAAGSNLLPSNAPTRDQVMTLLDLLQVRRTMSNMLENMKALMKQSAEEAFRKKIPNPTPKQLEALHAMFDDISDMPLDEMIDALIPIYQRHLTRTDIEEVIRFYSSPAGQKLLSEQPKMMQEGMEAGAAIQRKRMDEITAKIQERMQKLIEAGEDNGSAPKN